MTKEPTTLEASAAPPPQPPLNPQLEQHILHKLDLTLLPTLWLLFVISFADRNNIGNAKILGMEQDLDLRKNHYNLSIMSFTLAYVLFGIPSNLIFHKFGPQCLSIMMFVWGICALSQGLVRSWEQLVVCRFLMGVFEAGFVPGCASLIGRYYQREEFLKRYAGFFSGAIFAGAFNGLVSYGVARADGRAGLRGWRWVFLVEGVVTCVFAVAGFWLIPEFPEKTGLFRGEEKEVLLERLRRDRGGEEEEGRVWECVWEALRDWKIWLA